MSDDKGPRRTTKPSSAARASAISCDAVAVSKGKGGSSDLAAAITLGIHPLHYTGSMVYVHPPHVRKLEIIGGFFGEPYRLAKSGIQDLEVPTGAKIVIEGRILTGVKEPEEIAWLIVHASRTARRKPAQLVIRGGIENGCASSCCAQSRRTAHDRDGQSRRASSR